MSIPDVCILHPFFGMSIHTFGIDILTGVYATHIKESRQMRVAHTSLSHVADVVTDVYATHIMTVGHTPQDCIPYTLSHTRQYKWHTHLT